MCVFGKRNIYFCNNKDFYFDNRVNIIRKRFHINITFFLSSVVSLVVVVVVVVVEYNSLLTRRDRLIKVGDDIVDVFNTNRNANHLVVHATRRSLFRR